MLSSVPRSFSIPLALLVLVTLLPISLGTRFRPGLTPDTVLYLETADSLRAGEGLLRKYQPSRSHFYVSTSPRSLWASIIWLPSAEVTQLPTAMLRKSMGGSIQNIQVSYTATILPRPG